MVIIDRIRSENHRAEGRIRVGRRTFNVGFQSQLELSDSIAEALLLLTLPAAMRDGAPLVMEYPVSGQLISNIPGIQALYRKWNPALHKVAVEVKKRPREPRQPDADHVIRKAISFTGGVDSFYSALQAPRAALLYVHGLDIPLENAALRRKVGRKLQWAADQMDRPFFEMETNLRQFSDRHMDWHIAFGAALAACALLLSRHLDDFGIPAGQSSKSLLPDGAHPALNPLCGTEAVEIRTLGLETSRVEKTEFISRFPVVQATLRVCWENRLNQYNCGVCEKCLRTMAALEVFGALEKCTTFPVPLDYRRLSRAIPPDPALDFFVQENLDAARLNSADPNLVKTLEQILEPARSARYRRLYKVLPLRIRHWYYSASCKLKSAKQ